MEQPIRGETRDRVLAVLGGCGFLGRHLAPLQTRTRALDGTLRAMFERWYPGLANDNTVNADRAAAA